MSWASDKIANSIASSNTTSIETFPKLAEVAAPLPEPTIKYGPIEAKFEQDGTKLTATGTFQAKVSPLPEIASEPKSIRARMYDRMDHWFQKQFSAGFDCQCANCKSFVKEVLLVDDRKPTQAEIEHGLSLATPSPVPLGEPALLDETGHPSRLSDEPEEVLVSEFVDALRVRWEKMQPGVATVYTFEGYLGQQLMFARELLATYRKGL